MNEFLQNARSIRIFMVAAVATLCGAVCSSAQNYPKTLQETLNLGLPVLDIVTVNGEEPTCEYQKAPDGCMGYGIVNVTKVPGSIRRIEPNGVVSYDSGDFEDGASGMTMKIRGNSSAWRDRKPYKIKLQKKADLLCRGDKKFNDKNWAIINDYEMMHRNGYWVNELIGMDWTPQNEYVNVIINGNFRGVYMLIESVERNSDCRIDVSKTGFVTELDAYWWNENGQYVPSMESPSWNYTFKYPDYEDMNENQIQYAADVMMQHDKSLRDGTYDQYIDCDSYAAWLMGHDIVGTLDYGGSNMYFSKYDDSEESLLRRPTMWDFDATESMQGKWATAHKYMFKLLLESSNQTFLKAFLECWDSKGKNVCEEIIARLHEFQNTVASKAYDESMMATNARWRFEYKLSQECTDRSLGWYAERHIWLANAMEELRKTIVETGADSIEAIPEAGVRIDGMNVVCGDGKAFAVYGIDGRCVAMSDGSAVRLPSAGMYIVFANGRAKKVLAID